jgi:acetyl esterase/lipase
MKNPAHAFNALDLNLTFFKMKTTLLVATALFASLLSSDLAAQEPPARSDRPPGNGVRLPAGSRTFRNLEYIPGGHERQKLDLFLPDQTNQPLPLIIWVHGGAWQAGSKDNCPALRLVAQGYAVASINYRLSQHAVFPAQIEDCKAAVRWLRAHAKEYSLDPNHFGAWGSSAGGHLVALLGTTGDTQEFDRGSNLEFSSRVQAVVNFFGPAELTRMGEQSGPNSRMDHNAADSPESKLIGGAVQQNKEKAAKASPISYVSKSDPPMLLVHGDADPVVPHQQSEALHAALKKAGVETTLRIVKGAGHGNGFGPDVQALVARFFELHLKPAGDAVK